MCTRVTCPNCQKPTWSGCGQHIEQALQGVPEADRCHCTVAKSKGPGLFARLFSRK
ncbi:MAG: hypothetical protein WCL17_04195 [Actinomycetota bacterium]|jgi:hypothetical protein